DIRVAEAGENTENQTTPTSDNRKLKNNRATSENPEHARVDSDTKEVINELQSLDIESTAPVTLLQTVEQWQKQLTDADSEE
ncbi:hypothetical protein, partial [Haloquadratum walsbyi]